MQGSEMVKGFRGGRGQILPFHIDFDRRPYNTVVALYYCVILFVCRTERRRESK